jgi:hypothetical protein
LTVQHGAGGRGLCPEGDEEPHVCGSQEAGAEPPAGAVWEKRGPEKAAKIKTVPVRIPLSGGRGLENDQVHQMQEKKVRETKNKCKYGEENSHEKSPSLVKHVQEGLFEEILETSIEVKDHDSEVPEDQVVAA